MTDRPSLRAAWMVASLLVGLAVTAPAGAYCRTNTCDPRSLAEDACTFDDDGCEAGGADLSWPEPCVSFAVHEAGSELHGIPYETANAVIGDALSRWLNARCDGDATPGLRIFDFGPVSCRVQQYNQTGPNANVWLFHDDEWPYDAADRSTLALATITFNLDTGEIFDADVEINAANSALTVSDANVVDDLASIVTHEAGHFLGLAHSRIPSATMFDSYAEGATSLRTLDPDDEAGICAAYPPGTGADACTPDSASPRRGFTSECFVEDQGCCAVAPGSRRVGNERLAPFALVGLLAFALRRARRGRSS